MTAAPVSEFPYVEEYLDVLLRHGRKHITTDRYRQILGMILRGLHDMGRTTDPHKISEDDVYAVFASLNVVESSKVSYLYILRQWCRFYTNREVEQVRLLVNHEVPKRRWISEEDVSVSLHTTTHPQDRLIIYLGSAYGLRRGEIATLKVDDPRRAAQVVALRNGYISHNGYVSNEREFESRNI